MSPRKILGMTAVLFAVFFIFENSLLYAGGAAVAKRRQAAQQAAQQQAIQRAVIQRQIQQQAAVEATVRVKELQMHGQARLPIEGEIDWQVNIPHEGEITKDVLVPVPIDETQVKDIVNIEDLWKTFEINSENWPLIMEMQAKVLTVDRWIYQYKEKGVSINKPPGHYVQMIDGMSQQNPVLLNQPFDRLLQLMAIMEYDFDNGVDKDQLAKKILGEQAWQANRQRLGLP